MQTKPKGTIHRGSVAHHILNDLERYPDSWFQGHHFPDLDAKAATINRQIQRLIGFNKVEHRLVVSDNPGQRLAVEIRWKGRR